MTTNDRRDRRITAGILLGASAIMFVPLVANAAGRPIPLVQNLGFTADTLAPMTAWVAALLFALAYIAMTFKFIPSVRQQQSEISIFKLVGVVAALASGIIEEVVFRRWVMDGAAAAGANAFGQILLSGIVFGVAHLIWHTFSRDWRHSLIAACATTVAGFALAAIYLLAGRNLGPCIAAHFLINLVIEPWLVLDAVKGRNTGSQVR